MANVELSNNADVCRLSIRAKELIIGWQGREHSLKLSRGMEQLVQLMRYPGILLDYAGLESDAAVPQARYQQLNNSEERLEHQLHAAEDYLPLPLSDPKTVKEVKQRLLRLISEEAELEENCDFSRLDDIRDEKEALTQYLNEVYSPARRMRCFPDENLRQRKRVQKNLLRAIATIGDLEPELATKLKSCLQFHCGIVFWADTLVIEIGSY